MNALELAAARSQWALVSVAEKAILLLGITLCVIALPPMPALPLFALIILVCAWRARVPWRLYGTLVAAPTLFIAMGVGPLIFAITNNGIVFIDDGPTKAFIVLSRSVIAMSSTMIFAVTTPMAQLLSWLGHIGVPSSIVHVMSLTYRMTSTLFTTARIMWDAQAARLGHTNLSRWIRSVAGLIAALFIVAFTHAQRLGEGVSLRGDIETMHLVGNSHDTPARWSRVGAIFVFLISIGVICLYLPMQII
ncbi:cobalt ECF transporter T component CbiQ [Corynebacterium freiburgense]|uniref:cobalt ECF transporter T component CbiQ n=1 Tax=Corynebacterium freiburgense TaxID=556548 RepID=UPI000415E543|nr:cobalt ECF transporter T component CbiQ [Corynebacterium freiburgense]WJZ03365.1 Cobalt transport protein CbiQ [Corynebacterium freiburgense]